LTPPHNFSVRKAIAALRKLLFAIPKASAVINLQQPKKSRQDGEFTVCL
jgi:hypothetical protein